MGSRLVLVREGFMEEFCKCSVWEYCFVLFWVFLGMRMLDFF